MLDLLQRFREAPPSGILTLPNAVTAAGYGLALWHLRGGPGWAAVASVVADEVDGRLARATGQTSVVGSELDWGTDVALAAAYARKLGVPDVGVAGLAVVQSAMRARGIKPSVGSARAALMLADVALDARQRGVSAALLTPRK